MNKRIAFLIGLMWLSASLPAQPRSVMDVQHYTFRIGISDSDNVLHGDATIHILFVKDTTAVQLDLMKQGEDGKGMLVTTVTKEGHPLSFIQQEETLTIIDTARAGSENSYEIEYSGIPANGLIISSSKYGSRTFFADNWPNRAHDWLPCKDHLSDKASVEFVVTAPSHYQVVANGICLETTNIDSQRTLTHWREDVALPPDIFAIGVAAFAVNFAGDADTIPVYSWVYPQNRDKGFERYAIAKDILPWIARRVGPYPYRKLANVQSRTIFGGMENANTIFYSEGSVDSAGLEALMTHEIAHQWFGNSVTESDWPHLWLSEGFATYMADLYHESKYGPDSLKKRLITERDAVIKFSQKKQVPVVDTTESASLMLLLNANSYQKGAWVLHMLRQKIGDTLFWRGIRSYYAHYAGKNADTRDLQKEFEMVSHRRLDTFFRQWLYTPGQPKLDITWRYDRKKRMVNISISQLQPALFVFPLTLQLVENDQRQDAVFNIHQRDTTLQMRASHIPSQLIADPAVNLLFEGAVHEIQ